MVGLYIDYQYSQKMAKAIAETCWSILLYVDEYNFLCSLLGIKRIYMHYTEDA